MGFAIFIITSYNVEAGNNNNIKTDLKEYVGNAWSGFFWSGMVTTTAMNFSF